MAITITDRRMTSDLTSHHAFRWQEDGVDGWAVTFLPKIWTRDQAITAMTIVEAYARGRREELAPHGPGSKQADLTPFLRSWAAELGMTLDEVLAVLDEAAV